MSDQQPPSGGPSYGGPSGSGSSPDYGTHRDDLPLPPADSVTLGGGAWNAPSGGSRRRTWWYAGGGAVAAIALVTGGTVFAATHVAHHRDPGPAAGLPAATLAYAAIDLDPSAGQKIEALQALRKLPAFSSGISVDPGGDLRKLLLQDRLGGKGCNVNWDKDVAPWLGNDVGGALVPATGAGAPQPVAILAVTDEAAARQDLLKLLDCGTRPHGLSVADGWAVVAGSDSVARSVTSAAHASSLADDADFTTWTDRTGDPGVATFYVSKDAGRALAGSLSTLMSHGMFGSGMLGGGLIGGMTDGGMLGGAGTASYGSASAAPAAYLPTADRTAGPLLGGCLAGGSAASGSGNSSSSGSADGAWQDPLRLQRQQLSRLHAGAATVRFAHGGFEVESATANAGSTGTGDTGLAALPADTALAFGAAPGSKGIGEAVTTALEGLAQECGTTPSQLLSSITDLTGLTLPGDLQTLMGGGFAFAVSGALDPAALGSTGPAGLPAGLRIQGDPQRIAGVLDKLKVPGGRALLATTSGDGVVAVGPDAAYRTELAKKGSLGSSSAFADVVPHADRANAALFVSFDRLRAIIDRGGDVPTRVRDTLAHLRALGASTWQQDGYSQGLIRLSLQ